MLSLDDPLWKKLDDGQRDRSIPQVLVRLAEAWDMEAAKSLFWDCLCHQETCYGATYAAIPHLLRIAEPTENKVQRLEIALLAGFVALCALQPREDSKQSSDEPLLGLPLTTEGWNRKRDDIRYLATVYGDPDQYRSSYERNVLLPRYREILTAKPVNVSDIEKIKAIQAEFYASLPAIRALSERAFLENRDDKDALTYILACVAAADGLFDLATLLNCRKEGFFICALCDCRHEYILHGDRVAFYAEANDHNTRSHLDYDETAPSRCDGFVIPASGNEILTPQVAALLSLAARAPNPEPTLLLRHFLGHYRCGKCGGQSPLCAQ